MFDIKSLAVEDTHDVELDDPRTGEPLIGEGGKPCSVTVYGPGTKQFAAAQTAAANRTVKRLRSKGRNTDTTPEEESAARATFLTAITVSFNNFTYGGMEGGPDAFRALYLDPKVGFITDKVNGSAGDWANFSKAAQGN